MAFSHELGTEVQAFLGPLDSPHGHAVHSGPRAHVGASSAAHVKAGRICVSERTATT